MARKIVWQKWNDPFQPIVDHAKKLQSQEEQGYHDSYDDEVNNRPVIGRTPIAMTNWGFFPINDINRPGNTINFWLGHTNFEITNELAEAIELVKGVEALDIQTRYRFLVGIGKLFNSPRTKKRIEWALCTLPKFVNMGFTPKKIQEINQIHKNLKQNHVYWTMMILPNGSIDTFTGLNEDEVLEKYMLYKTTTSNTGGITVRHKNGNRSHGPSS